MNKKIISLLLAVIIMTYMTACGQLNKDQIQRDSTPEVGGRFIDTGDSYIIGNLRFKVCYDSKEKIVYLINSSYQQGAGMVMYNSNRQPMLIDEYNKTK